MVQGFPALFASESLVCSHFFSLRSLLIPSWADGIPILLLNVPAIRRDLQRHMVAHSDQKEHVCAECGAQFKRPERLKNHMEIHENKKSHICSECGKAFNCRRVCLKFSQFNETVCKLLWFFLICSTCCFIWRSTKVNTAMIIALLMLTTQLIGPDRIGY